MQLSTALITLLMGSVAAFTAPPNTAEGVVHVAYYNDEGAEIHVPMAEYLLSNASDTQSTESFAVHDGVVSGSRVNVKRQLTQDTLACGCGFYLNAAHTNNAVAAIRNDFNSKPGGVGSINPGTAFYSIQGSVVAFACNDPSSSKPWTVTSDSFWADTQKISQWCGSFVAGTEIWAGYGFKPSTVPWIVSAWLYTGYMRSGGDFCGHAADSLKTQC